MIAIPIWLLWVLCALSAVGALAILVVVGVVIAAAVLNGATPSVIGRALW